MIGGPNGSGKSTLLNYLGHEFDFPLGYCLNPDEIEREIQEHGRIYVGGWGMRIQEKLLRNFIDRHPLSPSSGRAQRYVRVKDNTVLLSRRRHLGYLTSILCDYLRLTWLKSNESFTFETVMSHPSKLQLLRRARRLGYRTYLYFVCTESAYINKARVAARVRQG